MIITYKLKKNYSKEVKNTFEEQVYYIDENIIKCYFKKNNLIIQLKKLLSINKIKIESQKLLENLEKSLGNISVSIIFENDVKINKIINPDKKLFKNNEVVLLDSGVFGIEGDFLKLIKKLDKVFKRYATKLNSIEQHFHSTLPLKSFKKNKYIYNFPHHCYFVTHTKEDIKSIRNLSNKKNKFNIKINDIVDKNYHILSPTICYHCFEMKKNMIMNKKNIHYTAIGSCHRFESKNINSLTRLQSFTMREIISFGTSDFIDTTIKNNIKFCINLFKKYKLKFRIITASDPFFISNENLSLQKYQSTMQLKHEMELFIPHIKQWISVASFNNHQQSLIDVYNIKMKSTKNLISGCVGYGYERMAYAILSQSKEKFIK